MHGDNHGQCPKLRVHRAPGVHIFSAECMIFGGVHPVCARFLSHLLLLYIRRVHGELSGCTVLGEVHPVSAQNKSLISDTAGYTVLGEVHPVVRKKTTLIWDTDTGCTLYFKHWQ